MDRDTSSCTEQRNSISSRNSDKNNSKQRTTDDENGKRAVDGSVERHT